MTLFKSRISPTSKLSIHYLLTFVKLKAHSKNDVYIIFTNVKKTRRYLYMAPPCTHYFTIVTGTVAFSSTS